MLKDELRHEEHCCNDETQQFCGCGCDCDNNEEEYIGEYREDCGCGCEDIEFEKIKLTLEDGRDVTALVIEVFQLEDKEYIALLPDEDDNILLYEFREHEDAIELVNIQCDEEFEAVSQAFLDLQTYQDIEPEE